LTVKPSLGEQSGDWSVRIVDLIDGARSPRDHRSQRITNEFRIDEEPMTEAAIPRVISVNVGAIREVEWRGEAVTTAIWKHPVAGRIALRGVNLVGDDQADRTVHGGPDKAVYAYSREDYAHWRDTQHLEVTPGLFGENLTTEGIDLSCALVGERWRVGTTVLEVAQIRLPCFKLGIRLGDPRFPRRFQGVGRMGAYLRVVQEGDVGVGDAIEVLTRPDHGITLGTMLQALDDPDQARALTRAEYLPSFWRRIADAA
jgi:MOSC domain-containing protein YiiM